MPINPSFPESRPGRNKPTASGFILPLVGVAGLAAAAIWFGGAPSALPTAQGIPVVSLLPVSGDPLPSWNAGPTKQAIINFIAAITEQGSETFVPVPERVAVFDNEGTLICEKPIVHGMFLLDRIHAMAFERPEMANEEPYATLLTGDIEAVRKLGKKYFIDLTFSTLAGVSEDQLENDARNFLETAIHPVFGVSYAEVTFQPMHELMELLRTNRFSIWICSGSGVQFMRPAAAAWYGIEPDRVIGSRAKTELREGQRHQVPRSELDTAARVDNFVGRVDATHRRDWRRQVTCRIDPSRGRVFHRRERRDCTRSARRPACARSDLAALRHQRPCGGWAIRSRETRRANLYRCWFARDA